MFETTTPQQLIDDVEAITDNDGYDLLTDAQMVSFMNDEITTMWMWATKCNRDIFTKSVEGQIASGNNYISITAAAPTGLGVADFLNVRGVDLKLGENDYRKIDPYNFVTRDLVGRISYKSIGDQLWLNPKINAAVFPFRLWYVYKAPTASVSALSASLSLPEGGGAYVKYGMAAKVRERLDESSAGELRSQESAKQNIVAWMKATRGDQGQIADTSGYFNGYFEVY